MATKMSVYEPQLRAKSGDLRNEANATSPIVTPTPKRRFAKRSQFDPSVCRADTKRAICETNPTRSLRLSLRRLKGDLRNEARFALSGISARMAECARGIPRS